MGGGGFHPCFRCGTTIADVIRLCGRLQGQGQAKPAEARDAEPGMHVPHPVPNVQRRESPRRLAAGGGQAAGVSTSVCCVLLRTG